MTHTLAEHLLQHLDDHYRGMPPVAAMQVTIAGYDGSCLRLRAPLSHNVNDKGCAFGGSLSSLMTLAAWGVVNLHVQGAGSSALFSSYNYHKLQFSGIYELNRQWALQAGLFTTVAGRNALQENGLVLGAWYRY